MKRLLFTLFFLLAASFAFASHIVGGEFEFIYKGYNGTYMQYSLNLILYFDLMNGEPGARDQAVTVRIFRKSDNAIMRNNITLYLTEETDVEYFQPECSSGSALQTSRLYYVYRDPSTGVESFINLAPSEFNDPGGYYISWERCCRNYALTNIYSESPELGSQNAGQTFYLEFPALLKNGERFVNSSPKLFPPLADYACPNRPYYVDFSGEDEDGDSLVYSMVTPLSTHYISPLPPGDLPLPGPYPDVTFRPGFTSTGIMKGKPELNISRDGVLTVTPTVAGLFAFAVKVEEYRDKVKIGELRRDFQMLVLTSCPVSQKPQIQAKHTNDPTSTFGNTITINENNLCFDVKIYDPDSKTRKETVTISAYLVNDRRRNITSQIVSNPVQVLQNDQPAIFSLCFPACPLDDKQHVVGIVVSDKSCPLPAKDTVFVTVEFLEPKNVAPVFDKELVTDVVTEGLEIPAWKQVFTGTDGDGDNLQIVPDPENDFDPAAYGFSLSILEDSPGKITAQLNWDTRCDVFDFSKKTDFIFSYQLLDLDECQATPVDVITFDLTRDFKDFHYPVITYPPDADSEHITFDQKIYETLTFEVEGSDIDNDMLDLKGNGIGFNMNDVGASFPDKTFQGKGRQTFSWKPDCSKIDLDAKGSYDFEMVVIDDDNICHYQLTDTLLVTVNLLPPDNQAPELFIDGSPTRIQKTITAGDAFVIPVQGKDADTDPMDLLTLTLVDATGNIVVPENFTFESTPAKGVVDGTLTWTPDCNVFAGGIYESDFVFTFKVNDDRCYSGAEDLLEVDVHVIDRENPDADFNPRPNVVSSNRDGLNDFFGMYKLGEDGKTLENILPVDNCAGRFVDVFIYNRWGRKVFTSSDREFRWYPDEESTGVYYYNIKYSNREYNGVISVVGEGSK